MKRIDVYITDNQKELIKVKADATGVSFAEMLRRLLDEAIIKIQPSSKTKKWKEKENTK